MPSARSGLALLAITVFAAACERVPTAASARGSAAVAAALEPEARFAALEREIPGFGGYFRDADGVLAAYVSDPASDATTRARLADVALDAGGSAHGTRTARVRIRRGLYSWSQLAAWRDRLAPLLAMPDVVFVDADEAANAVRVGVIHSESAPAVRAAAARLRVPLRAMRIAAELPMTPFGELGDPAGASVPGGYRISHESTPRTAVQCSLGFNAADGSYVTAAHCSRAQGAVDGTVQHQPGAPHQVGVEDADPPLFAGGPCPPGRRCRYSDAARFAYTPGHAPALSVARTTAWGTSAAAPTTVSATMPVWGERPFPTVGETLDKMGAATGWTYGAVTATCVHVNVDGTDLTLLCQDVVKAHAQSGDSGGPVFVWRGDRVSLAGILWGGTATHFYFSAMWNVEHDLGPLRTF